jgi:hypothetical protein
MTAEQVEECRKAWHVLADATPSLKSTEPTKWEAALSALMCLTCYIHLERKDVNRRAHAYPRKTKELVAAVGLLLLAALTSPTQAATNHVGHPLKGYVSITSNLVQGVKLHQSTEAKKAKALPTFTEGKRRIQCPQCKAQGLTVYVEEQAIGYATDACVECDWRIATVWHCDRGHQGANDYLAKGGKRERKNPHLSAAVLKQMHRPLVQVVLPVDPAGTLPELTPVSVDEVPSRMSFLSSATAGEVQAQPPVIRHIPLKKVSLGVVTLTECDCGKVHTLTGAEKGVDDVRSVHRVYTNPEGVRCENWQVEVPEGIWHWVVYGSNTNVWFEAYR